MLENDTYNLVNRTIKLRKDVSTLKDKIKEIRSRAEGFNSYINDMPKDNRIGNKVLDMSVRLNEMNLILAQKFKVFVYLYSTLIEQCNVVLSDKEKEIVILKVKSGYSNPEIAKKLHMANSTVGRKLTNITEKIINYNKEIS